MCSDDIIEMVKEYENIDVVKVDDINVVKVWNMFKVKVFIFYVLVVCDVVYFLWFI